MAKGRMSIRMPRPKAALRGVLCAAVLCAVLLAFAAAAALAADPEALYREGLRLMARGDSQAAADSFRQALAISPNYAEAWKALGVVYAAAGDTARAEEPFHRACLLNPKLPDACLYFGRALYLLDRFPDAIAVVKTALESDPNNAQLYRIQALALEGSGKMEEAEAAFREAIRNEKNSAANEDPSIDYGVFLYRGGRAAQAIEPLSAAVAHHPESGRAQLELGCALLSLERVNEAAPHLEKAATLDPSNSRAHLLLGKAYERMGKTALARRELDQGSRMVK